MPPNQGRLTTHDLSEGATPTLGAAKLGAAALFVPAAALKVPGFKAILAGASRDFDQLGAALREQVDRY